MKEGEEERGTERGRGRELEREKNRKKWGASEGGKRAQNHHSLFVV